MTINDKIEKSPKVHVDPERDEISCDGETITYIDKVYLMLNKPQDVISATEDDAQRTVIDRFQNINI